MDELYRRRLQERCMKEALVCWIVLFICSAAIVAVALSAEKQAKKAAEEETVKETGEAETTAISPIISIETGRYESVGGRNEQETEKEAEEETTGKGTGTVPELYDGRISGGFRRNNTESEGITSDCAESDCGNDRGDSSDGSSAFRGDPEDFGKPTEKRYAVNGTECPYAAYLYEALLGRGIAWFMPYALCQCYQESRFDRYAVSYDGKDHGIFQYRQCFWTGGDIYNPYFQIEHYANAVKMRMNQGKDVYTVISDHYTGECGYNEQYVSDVLQWLDTVEEIDD